MKSEQFLQEASWVNGKISDPKSLRWKQTSMSYEEAVAEFGADHVRREGKARDGHEVIAVLVPLGPLEEAVANEEKLLDKVKKSFIDYIESVEDTLAKKTDRDLGKKP